MVTLHGTPYSWYIPQSYTKVDLTRVNFYRNTRARKCKKIILYETRVNSSRHPLYNIHIILYFYTFFFFILISNRTSYNNNNNMFVTRTYTRRRHERSSRRARKSVFDSAVLSVCNRDAAVGAARRIQFP